jgi:hypothetical protein
MKYVWILILMFSAAIGGHAAVVNSIVANIGQYSISRIDIQRMDEFLKVSRTTNNDALTELILVYSIFSSIENDDQITFKEAEVDNTIKALTNTNGNPDPMAKSRLQLFLSFPDEYKLEIKKNQVIRTLTYYKPELKTIVDEIIPDSELKTYYLNNKKYFVNPPQLDMYVLAVPQPPDASLDKLDEIERALCAVTNALRKTDDATPVVEKYKTLLNPEPYSGRTGYRPIVEIFNSGCPEELINFALIPSIPLRSGPPLIVKNGTVIGYEKFMFKSSPRVVHYFIIKVLNKKLQEPMTFEESKSAIVNILKEEKIKSSLQKFIINKINRSEISVNIIDKSYEGVYNEFLRR